MHQGDSPGAQCGTARTPGIMSVGLLGTPLPRGRGAHCCGQHQSPQPITCPPPEIDRLTPSREFIEVLDCGEFAAAKQTLVWRAGQGSGAGTPSKQGLGLGVSLRNYSSCPQGPSGEPLPAPPQRRVGQCGGPSLCPCGQGWGDRLRFAIKIKIPFKLPGRVGGSPGSPLSSVTYAPPSSTPSQP